MVQLYLYFTTLIAVLTLAEGGDVAGFTPSEPLVPSELDAWMAAQTSERAFPAFDASVIPDLLPDAPSQQATLQLNKVEVDELVPNWIPATGSPTDVYAKGTFPAGVQLKLMHGDTLAPPTELTVTPIGDGQLRLGVAGPPGVYRAFVRRNDMEQWQATDALLEIRTLQTSVLPSIPIPSEPGP